MASDAPKFVQLHSISTRGNKKNFADALSIWINKPHVVNRRLCGSKVISIETFAKADFKSELVLEKLKLLGYKLIDVDFFCNGFMIKQENSEEKIAESFLHMLEKSVSSYKTMNSEEYSERVKHEDTVVMGPECSKIDSSVVENKNSIETNILVTHHVNTEVISNEHSEFLNTKKHDSGDMLCVEGLADYEEDFVVIIRELVPKQPDRHRNIPELIIYDNQFQACTFYPITRTDDSEKTEKQMNIEVVYQFCYSINDSSITLSVSHASFSEDSSRKLSLTWLKGQLLPKIARWSEEPNLKTSLTSLKLIPLEEYNALYNELKVKYGQHFAKIWPEKTDPQKYVFEDVAIATYLLLLWKQDREKKGLIKKQSFVDLGCGNGLLVHILSAEGHRGYGIDVRKRNIWDLYGSDTVLKEMPITPSRDCLFPDSDWLIGNHSDELTPWIPVMAARSSYSCCYFVLPCCHHDFDTKFSQCSVGGSQYREYLNYIQTVGENCGFIVEEDMLRIPSTKRVCFVGKSRSYAEKDENLIDEKRTAFINSRCNQNKTVNGDSDSLAHVGKNVIPNQGEKWSTDFEPRSKVETTRNCVTVRQETKEVVIRSVFEKLMSCDTCEVKQLDDGKTWRKGGMLPISDVVKLFDSDLLQELKSECGGIQTLLRNSSQIFQVTSGMVQLRDFTQADPWGRKRKGKKTDNGDYVKTSLCWFNLNHPDGCPRTSEQCDYAHSNEELRPRPSKVKKLTP